MANKKKFKGKPEREHTAHEEDGDSKSLEEWKCNVERPQGPFARRSVRPEHVVRVGP